MNSTAILAQIGSLTDNVVYMIQAQASDECPVRVRVRRIDQLMLYGWHLTRTELDVERHMDKELFLFGAKIFSFEPNRGIQDAAFG